MAGDASDSTTESETDRSHERDARLDPDDVRWTTVNREDLVEIYWHGIAPDMIADGMDPETERPTHQWLRDNGYRSLLRILRENFDLTFQRFWRDELDTGPQSTPTDNQRDGSNVSSADDQTPNRGQDDTRWPTADVTTIELLDGYLDSLRNRGKLSETTIDTLRHRLAAYVRAYDTVTGSDDLVSPIMPSSETPIHEATDACWAAIDHLDDTYDSGATKSRIYRAVNNWYAHLVRRNRATVNPVKGLDDEYAWSEPTGDNPALSPAHIRALVDAASEPRETLLVVALSAWGLRSSEVAGLHRDQVIIPDDGTPYVTFDERKNGPGEVSILYGLNVYLDRVATLNTGGWNGYLFPSTGAEEGHITRKTVLNRFDKLASQADLPDEIEGAKPVPKMGRRFWYNAYSKTLDSVLEGIDEIAAEQGSSDPTVVLQNYLSQERTRELRREQMRKQLAEAFEPTELTDNRR